MTLEEHEKQHPNLVAEWRKEIADGHTVFGLDEWVSFLSGSPICKDMKTKRYRAKGSYQTWGNFDEQIFATCKSVAHDRVVEMVKCFLAKVEPGMKKIEIESITEEQDEEIIHER